MNCSATMRSAKLSTTRQFQGSRRGLPAFRPSFSPRTLRTHQTRVAEAAIDPSVQDYSLPLSGPEVEPSLTLSNAGENYNWAKNWYPVAVIEMADTRRPNPVQLLGSNLVIWKDAESKEWHCFEDRCPHRAAPLSEGKINGGVLTCSYHGWDFAPSGAAVRVPQSASKEAEERACASKRACAVTRPIAEAQGLLFVWGEAGPQAEEESKATPLPIDALLQGALERGDKIMYVFPPYFRDLPYDYQTLVENVVDPAHVPFSHHGVQGNRDRVQYGDYEMKMEAEPGMLKVGYSSVFGPGFVTFQPPCYVNIGNNRPDGLYSSFKIYCVPTTPGNSRLVAFVTTNKPDLPPLFKLMKRVPRWLDHIVFRHPVLDGDNVFLHYQEHFLEEAARKAGSGNASAGAAAGGKDAVAAAPWRKFYFMPTRADTLVAAFKNWLDTAGGSGPFGPLHQAPSYGPLVTDHRVLLNRYEQHTKNCVTCKRALKWLEAIRKAAAAVAALGFGTAVAAAVQAGGIKALVTRASAGPALVGMLGALVWQWVGELREKFYFVDYCHADR